MHFFLRACARSSKHGLNRLYTLCSTFSGYVIGLSATIIVMNVFKAAQPALLYLVPAIIAAVAIPAAIKGEFKEVSFQYCSSVCTTSVQALHFSFLERPHTYSLQIRPDKILLFSYYR